MINNNEFGIESIINDGLGFSDSLFAAKKSNFDGDFDSLRLELGSTENLANFAETYSQLDVFNADQKIRMLKKLHIHTKNVPGKYGESIEKFIIEQSIEDASTKEAYGESSGANPAKLPKEEIKKEHSEFFTKIWETLKKIFNKIVTWFREKLQWLADKIGKRPTTSESIQVLSTCSSEESKDIWEALASNNNELDASKKSNDIGKVICISAQSINNFVNSVNSFNTVGQDLVTCANCVQKQGGYMASNGDSGLSYNNIVKVVADIRKRLSDYIPGGKQVPEQISTLDKDSIAKFNRQFKEALSYLQWDHDPEGYTQIFTKTNLIEKKVGSNAVSVASAQYGTTNPSELRKLIPSMTENLANIKNILNKLEKDVDTADKSFKAFFSNKDRNILDNNGNLKEYDAEKDNSSNQKKILSATVVYQFVTTTMSAFKMMNKLISIALHIHELMNTELVKLTNVLDKAAKAKKERKWFQFKKKDRDAKESNDTLKEAGLDTENEEKVDKRNANWDKLDNLKKDASKVGEKIGKGAQEFGKTKAGTGLRNAADAFASGLKSTAQDLLGKDKEAANTRKNLEKRINKREENAEKRSKDAAKSRMAKDNAKTKTTESWLLNPEDYI